MYLEKYNKNKSCWETFDFWELNEYYLEDEGEDKWVVCEFDDHRWYDKFCILQNGVRGEANGPYVPDKGFPSDACPEVNAVYKRWELDAHSPNWCTASEFRHLVAQYRVLRGSESPLANMHEALENHIKRKLKWNHIIENQNMDHIRMVYWFDN